MFAEGSSVHLYRVFFYSSFFTLAIADLASDAYAAAHRLFRPRAGVASGRRRRGAARRPTSWPRCRTPGTTCSRAACSWARSASRTTPRAAEAALRRRGARAHVARRARHHPLPAPRRAQGVLVLHRSQLRRDPDRCSSSDRLKATLRQVGAHPRRAAALRRPIAPIYEPSDRGAPGHLLRELHDGRSALVDAARAVLRVRAAADEPRPIAGSSRTSIRRWRWCERAYLPGECEALTLGVPVATDEQLDEPADARLLPCYHDLLVDRGQDVARAPRGRASCVKPLTAARSPARPARASSPPACAPASFEVALAPGGAEHGELRYQLSRDGKVGALDLPIAERAPARALEEGPPLPRPHRAAARALGRRAAAGRHGADRRAQGAGIGPARHLRALTRQIVQGRICPPAAGSAGRVYRSVTRRRKVTAR